MKLYFIIDKIQFRIIEYGGELSVQNNPKTLGDVIKYAREQSNYTVEQLAERIGITERYLYKLENEGKKPSYDVLYKLVRTLSISSDSIFFPENNIDDLELKKIILLLSNCDQQLFKMIAATIYAIYESYK